MLNLALNTLSYSDKKEREHYHSSCLESSPDGTDSTCQSSEADLEEEVTIQNFYIPNYAAPGLLPVCSPVTAYYAYPRPLSKTLAHIPLVSQKTPLLHQQGLQQFPATKTKIDANKEKSELCKSFADKGFCPYNNKCKFAHGSHELRQNQELNTRYKTKQCGSYCKNWVCFYGARCNFVHNAKGSDQTQQCQQKWSAIMKQHRETIQQSRPQSRLLQLLGKEPLLEEDDGSYCGRLQL